MRQVVLRLAGLHGDAAQRAGTDRGTWARCHRHNIGPFRRLAIDPGQCRRRRARAKFSVNSSDLSQCRICNAAQTDAPCGSAYRPHHSTAILKSRSSMTTGRTPWCSRAGGFSMAGSRRKPESGWTCTRPIGANGGIGASAPCAFSSGARARRAWLLPRFYRFAQPVAGSATATRHRGLKLAGPVGKPGLAPVFRRPTRYFAPALAGAVTGSM